MKIIPFALIFLSLFFYGGRGDSNSVSDVNQDSLIGLRMKPEVVTTENFARKELYTWTTAVQIDELKSGKALLSRSVSAKGDSSTFDLILSDTARYNSPVAKVLRTDMFAKKRFGWASAWPTVMGWEGENYGDQLLKITLKDSAIIVEFSPFCDSLFRYVDINGKPLSEQYVVDHKNQIAAVYFCAAKIGSRTMTRGTVGKPKKMNSAIHYREYVICNESMIASWEYGTKNVLAEMNSEISLLNDFGNFLKADGNNKETYYFGYSDPCWTYDPGGFATTDYYSVIAFPNDFYLLHPDRIAKISATMQKALLAQKDPVTH
ncbi:MAG TPA: hypothetical protein VL651_02700 [Bacteroidia bacterium]|nr:hypothetical protein [Bacteroidia bacterium]